MVRLFYLYLNFQKKVIVIFWKNKDTSNVSKLALLSALYTLMFF